MKHLSRYILSQMAGFPLRLNNIFLYIHATLSLSTRLITDIWAAPVSQLLSILLRWTCECRYIFEVLISGPLDMESGVELLDHMVVLCLLFWGTSILFVVIFYSLDNSHPNRCEFCGFDVHFPDDCSCWASFLVNDFWENAFFRKMSLQIFCPSLTRSFNLGYWVVGIPYIFWYYLVGYSPWGHKELDMTEWLSTILYQIEV